MKARVHWMASILAVLLVAPVWAGKIGFLDAERAVATVAEGKVQLQALEEWAIPRRQEVERLQQQVTELTRELATRRGVAAQETVRQLENELLQARRTFEDAGRSFNRDLEAKQNELLGEVARKIGAVAGEYGKANEFDAIFLYNAQPLAYIADAANVTDIVIRLYDERFPVN